LILILVILSFSGIVFELIPAGTAIQKSLLLLLLFLSTVNYFPSKHPKGSILLILPFIFFLIYCTVSAYWLSGSLSYVFSVLVPLLIGPLSYLYLISIRPSFHNVTKFQNLFLLICALQILFSFIKYFLHGIDEKVLIGSMSHNAGQLGFLFPSLAIPIVVYCLKGKNNLLMWLLIVGLCLFGLINEKRSVIFLFPLIIFFSINANSSHEPGYVRQSRLRQSGLAIIVGLATVSLGVAVIPSLSNSTHLAPANSFFYPIQYAFEYLTMDYGGNLQGTYQDAMFDENIQVGRFVLISSIFDWLYNSAFLTKLFGLGFGVATPSEWIGQSTDPLFPILGTRGAISGAGLALIETGLIGFGLITLFFVRIYFSLQIAIKSARNAQSLRWYKTLEVLLFLTLYDFFFYSTVLFRTIPMPLIFFALLSTMVSTGKLCLSGGSDHKC